MTWCEPGTGKEAKVTGGGLTVSDETTEFAWCSPDELDDIDVMEHHIERIDDAVRGDTASSIR